MISQQATKVIVGDTHQQIYSWRYAVNSLEKADFKTHHLSISFRFSQDIANLAMKVLEYKKHLNEKQQTRITGKGVSKAQNTKAVIARTNLGLLLKAIEYVTEKRKVKHIYFEGNINSYTYADEGASLYDVLNLYNGKHTLIKDKLIAVMKNMDELEDYIEKTEDVQLGMMMEIVKEYGNEIPAIIKAIKEKHVEGDDKGKAEMVFSTVHRCKGMEYDAIQLVNDFITEEKLEQQVKDKDTVTSTAKLNEEINLLYVAVTRTRNAIYIPETLMPGNFPVSSQVHIMRTTVKQEQEKAPAPYTAKIQVVKGLNEFSKDNTYSVEKIRDIHKDAYKPWTKSLDGELISMHSEGLNIRDLAKHFGRTRGAIEARLKKLGIE